MSKKAPLNHRQSARPTGHKTNWKLPFLALGLLAIPALSSILLAQSAVIPNPQNLKADIFSDVFQFQRLQQNIAVIPLVKAQNVQKVEVNCLVDGQDKPVYSGEFVKIEYPLPIQPGELFNIRVTVKNTGNMPWFSSNSGCAGDLPIVYLGTTHEQDRGSIFQAVTTNGGTGWYSSNRIILKTDRVNPGEDALFSFVATAPSTPGLYREYFAPVVEGKTWIKDKAEFFTDLKIGEPEMNQDILKYTSLMTDSVNLLDTKFVGDKKIQVDLSEQKMTLLVNGQAVDSFRVSTGKRSTPTYPQKTKIISKQEVRIGKARPHYIMPRFMLFNRAGAGFHALPSLANDKGVFWREALSHIGIPVSHGCIRLLPDEAEVAFQFADVGTPVEIVR